MWTVVVFTYEMYVHFNVFHLLMLNDVIGEINRVDIATSKYCDLT